MEEITREEAAMKIRALRLRRLGGPRSRKARRSSRQSWRKKGTRWRSRPPSIYLEGDDEFPRPRNPDLDDGCPRTSRRRASRGAVESVLGLTAVVLTGRPIVPRQRQHQFMERPVVSPSTAK